MTDQSCANSTQGSATAESNVAHNNRIGIFDAVRGFSVISMVFFHLCYDLRFLAGVSLPWFAPPLQDIWRASISWTFLFIAGCMCALSRNNLKRGLSYAAVALAIYVVTVLAAVDTPISFGIIYCMSACTLVAWALGKAKCHPKGPIAATVLLICFLLALGIPSGTIGIVSSRLLSPKPSTEFRVLHGWEFQDRDSLLETTIPLFPLFSCTLWELQWALGSRNAGIPIGQSVPSLHP